MLLQTQTFYFCECRNVTSPRHENERGDGHRLNCGDCDDDDHHHLRDDDDANLPYDGDPSFYAF